MLARILRNRDVKTDSEIEMYLNGCAADMYDPFLLKGSSEAAALICAALKGGVRIRIIGDYDADGVCSSYILFHYLEFIGADVSVYLPDRVRDGYGMNEEMVLKAGSDGVGLIITCDNGISASEAVSKAKELGIKVIITDHHTPPKKLPDADVIIDPKQEGCRYPYKEICGAAVAYKLMQCLSQSLFKDDAKALAASDETLDYLLLFAGIATITDIVPLKDENRILAKEALKRLKNTPNPGLRHLLEIKNVDLQRLSSWHIGFIVGPAINSAGRLENASLAFDLLNEKDEGQAYKKAQHLCELNERRKKLTQEQSTYALKIAEERMKKDKVLVLYLPGCHESVAGIIAGRIKEEKNRPAIVITDSKEGLKGSGRSIDGYNIIEEISKHPRLFKKFGGHARACGFTLKCSVQELSDVLNKNCTLTEEDLVRKVWIDMQLPFEYATQEFARELELAEPFGMDNEQPLFAERDITVVYSCIAGKNKNALRLTLMNKNHTKRDGIMFGSEEEILRISERIKENPEILITYYPEINEFRNKRSVQLKIQSIKFKNE